MALHKQYLEVLVISGKCLHFDKDPPLSPWLLFLPDWGVVFKSDIIADISTIKKTLKHQNTSPEILEMLNQGQQLPPSWHFVAF